MQVCQSYSCKIYMAGSFDLAKDICRKECWQTGWCVNISKVDYIYTGGEESGFVIEAINYARFPEDNDKIMIRCEELAEKLANQLYQKSYSIVDNKVSKFYQNDIPKNVK